MRDFQDALRTEQLRSLRHLQSAESSDVLASQAGVNTKARALGPCFMDRILCTLDGELERELKTRLAFCASFFKSEPPSKLRMGSLGLLV